jgi:hypothetical protein
MAQPKLFIGSSEKNLRVAKLLAGELEKCAQVIVWNEDVFGLNRGNLETLLSKLEEYDFAVFVLAPDDMTESKGETKPSPRDNVIFESGLFMGVLGRDRVFLVYDEAVPLKILSDLAGITLAGYDGSRIHTEGKSAVRDAGDKISMAITAVRYEHIVGDWRSIYPMTFMTGYPMANEVLEIKPGGNGLSFITKSNVLGGYYSCSGRLIERQIIGTWKSRAQSNDMKGVFVLTLDSLSTVMYGYFTSPDIRGGVFYATWVLAKMAGAEEPLIEERLKKAQELMGTTVTGPTTTEDDQSDRTPEPIAQV